MRLREKIFIIFLNIFLTLLLIELVLRCLGFSYNLFYKPPKAGNSGYSIFCICESTTWGMGTKNPPQDGYPNQLESILNKKYPGKKIKCFLDQTIGQNTSEMLLKLPGYIKKYHPDLVILMAGANNWWNLDNSNIMLFNDNKVISDISLRTLVFLDHFRVWKLCKWINLSFGLYKSRWDYWFIDIPDNARIDIQEWQKKALPVYYKLTKHDILTMLAICKEEKIKAIVCNYPMGAWHLRVAEEDWLSLDSIQKEAALKTGVPFVDNYTVFNSANNKEKLLSKDKWHPNKKGYSVVANNIFECIVENQFIEKNN